MFVGSVHPKKLTQVFEYLPVLLYPPWQARDTVALLHIELLGSRIGAGKIKEVSIVLRALPHRKNTKRINS
jgi:hypothetical protein